MGRYPTPDRMAGPGETAVTGRGKRKLMIFLHDKGYRAHTEIEFPQFLT